MARLELGNIRGSFKTTKLKKNVRPKHKGSTLHLRVNALEPPQEDQGVSGDVIHTGGSCPLD